MALFGDMNSWGEITTYGGVKPLTFYNDRYIVL